MVIIEKTEKQKRCGKTEHVFIFESDDCMSCGAIMKEENTYGKKNI